MGHCRKLDICFPLPANSDKHKSINHIYPYNFTQFILNYINADTNITRFKCLAWR